MKLYYYRLNTRDQNEKIVSFTEYISVFSLQSVTDDSVEWYALIDYEIPYLELNVYVMGFTTQTMEIELL